MLGMLALRKFNCTTYGNKFYITSQFFTSGDDKKEHTETKALLTGRWLSGTSTWPRKSSLVCQIERKGKKRTNFTSEKQKLVNINPVNEAKIKMVEYHYFSNYWFLSLYCCTLSVVMIYLFQQSIFCDSPNQLLSPQCVC